MDFLRLRLYNLKEDIGESNNLIDTMPGKGGGNEVLANHDATIPKAVPAKPERKVWKKHTLRK